MSGNTWTYSIYRSIWNGLDMIFPPLCGGCKKPGSRWCADCQKRAPVLPEPVCETCGLPMLKTGMCDLCREEKPAFHSLRAWCVFDEPVRDALLRLKYRHDVGLGDALAGQVIDFVRSLHWPIDVVVPIPLGKKRLKERGYNQTALIAHPLALSLKLTYAPGALVRQHETRSQVGLNKSERQKNVRGAFAASRTMINGKTVLVVDDVSTTGSTLSSGAEALFASGAKDVYALTIARALPRHGLATV